MTTRKLFTAIGLGLAAWSFCAANAYAQERPASPKPQDGDHPAVVVVPGDIPWHTFEMIERRYKIEALRFKARDETGVDWPGSDEVMVGTFDPKGSTVSNEIGDIDSGDTHHFDPAKSCIVAVRPGEVVLGKSSVCDDGGEPAPLWFEVELWEQDIYIFGFCSHLSANQEHYTSHTLHCGTDDFIGRARLDFPIQDLETALPHVGDEVIETVVLGGCPPGVSVCTSGWGPWDDGDYSFTYRVTRLPDVRFGLRGVLDEAMRKIGTGSEFEAIVAGLRALRAPTPRKIEPETGTPPSER